MPCKSLDVYKRQEIYYGKVYYSYEELKQAIIKYMDYYNNKRIKQKLGWLRPVEYLSLIHIFFS